MNTVKRFEVWIFLAAILIANATFITLIVEGILPGRAYNFGRFLLLGGVLFALVFWIRGKAGVVDVLRPMTVWRKSPWFYLLALTWTAIICLIVLTGKGLLTGKFLELDTLIPGLEFVQKPYTLLTLAVGSFFGEIVWISYALRKLSEQFTVYISALIVGTAWTLWWMPMVYYNMGVIPDLPVIPLLINQTGIAAMCAFVYHHTRSGLMILIMQAVFNATILIFPVTPTNGGVETYWAFAIFYHLAVVLLIFGFGPKPMFRVSKDNSLQFQN